MIHRIMTLGWVVVSCGTLAAHAQHQHSDDFLVGAGGGANAQLVFEVDEDVLSEVHVLAADDYGGFSTEAPGFDHVSVDEPAEDVFALASGAEIWLQIASNLPAPGLSDLEISPALFIFEPWSLTFYPYEEWGTVYREVYLGGHLLHAHVAWFLDSTDLAYDPAQCVWEVTCRFIDKGTTNYAPSEPFTLRFAAHELVPGDFDCDQDVDADDLVLFEACHAGPAIPLAGECGRFDLDGDGDADATDFATIQRCWSGPGIAGNPACAGVAE